MVNDRRARNVAARTWALSLLAAVLLAACGSQGTEGLPDKVTVQLKWVHQAQFAGFYAADKKGFYAEENLDVTLVPGGPDTPPAQIIASLSSGEADLAIVGGDQLLAARSQGEPVVAIAVVFQRNPYVYASLKESGIGRPQDLVGKRVMVPAEGEVQHDALLHRVDIDPDLIEIVPYERDVTPLLTGQVDAHMMYRTGTGLALDEMGYELNWLWIDDYGIRFYADTIITSERLAQSDPELVERFLRATMKGWRYAIENPDQAVDMVLEYDPTLTEDRQMRMMEAQMALIHTGEAEMGWMRDDVWREMHNILLEQGILEASVDLDEAYTVVFLQK